MEAKEKKVDDQEKKTQVQQPRSGKRERKRRARWMLAVLVGTLLMCSILMLQLVVDEPTQAELIIYDYARQKGISALQYPPNLVELLESNPETQEFVLNYPFREKDPEIDFSAWDMSKVPPFMQWDKRWGYMAYGDAMVANNGSGPLCLAMAGYYVTGKADFHPDRVVEFARESGFDSDGSDWTIITVGAKAMGLEVTELAVEEGKIAAYLQGGYPIIAAMGSGDFSDSRHFIVLTGSRDGKLTLIDPASGVNSSKEWDFSELKGQIDNLWLIQAGSEE